MNRLGLSFPSTDRCHLQNLTCASRTYGKIGDFCTRKLLEYKTGAGVTRQLNSMTDGVVKGVNALLGFES